MRSRVARHAEPRGRTVALSVRQPWAWLIVAGHKDIENRTWRTHHRGRILIHASQRIDAAMIRALTQAWPFDGDPPESFVTGGIIGEVSIIDCVTESASSWFHGPHGFVLANARMRRFRACIGHTRLFNPVYA